MSASAEITNIIRQWMDVVATRALHDHARYVKASGLSMPQFFVLMQLHHHGKCGVTDIGDRMETTSAAASQLIDRLVQSGLLARAEDPDDRRAKQIALTEKGRTLIEKGIAERYRWVEDLAASLTAEEQAAVLKALPPLIEALKKLETSEKWITVGRLSKAADRGAK